MPAPDKLKKAREVVGEAKQAAEIGQAIVPGKAGKALGKGVDMIEVAEQGLTLFEKFKAIFRRNRK